MTIKIIMIEMTKRAIIGYLYLLKQILNELYYLEIGIY